MRKKNLEHLVITGEVERNGPRSSQRMKLTGDLSTCQRGVGGTTAECTAWRAMVTRPGADMTGKRKSITSVTFMDRFARTESSKPQ